MLAWMLFVACGAVEVVVSSSAPACENVDFTAGDSEDVLDLVESSITVDVVHWATEAACEAVFEPDLVLDGRNLSVREAWSGGDFEACSVCTTPTITFKDPEPGRYEVTWYLEDGSEPLDTVEFKVK